MIDNTFHHVHGSEDASSAQNSGALLPESMTSATALGVCSHQVFFAFVQACTLNLTHKISCSLFGKNRDFSKHKGRAGQ